MYTQHPPVTYQCHLLGRHCCLFCNITTEEMKTPPHDRPQPVEQRSLATLQRDHNSFIASGGNAKNVKNHNNVLRPAIFDIPLFQVS